MQPNPATLTLRDYIAPVLRRWKMIVVVVIVVTAGVGAYDATRPETFTASTKVFLGPTTNGTVGAGASEPSLETAQNEAVLLTSSETAAQVAKRIGFAGSPGALVGGVSASASETTNFIFITATKASAAEAASVANAFAQQFILQNAAASQAAANQQLVTLRHQLASLKGAANAPQRSQVQYQIQQLQLATASAIGKTTQVDAAAGAVANRHSPVKFGALAALGSLIGAILLAYGLERVDPRLKSVHEASAVYQHPVLAAVVHDDEVESFVDGMPALSAKTREAFRQLRLALDLAAPAGRPFRTIVVTSAVPAEGKSTVARNLTLALSESGRRTLLIDADLRRPRLARALGLEPGFGLSHILAGEKLTEEVVVHLEGRPAEQLGLPTVASTDGQRPAGFQETSEFSFIAAGERVPNPPVALESDAFAAMLAGLAQDYEVVVIDTAPVVAVSDAIPLIQRADAVLLVARATTDSRSAGRAAQLISTVPDANVVGLVINDIPGVEAAAYGSSYGGYADYAVAGATKS
jgi:succinoglycan biosynthesis transport protein ExoP